MRITSFKGLVCPLDGELLSRADEAWRCPAGHSFDIARQGYVNLLSVQHKRSRDPGDSKEMVAARRRFLNAGFYKPIADTVRAETLHGLLDGASASCLDAGCGEGYYLRQLAAAEGRIDTLALAGVDISKWAVLAAAQQDPRPQWLVASNARLPVVSGSLDRVLCLFGFPVYEDFARVLKPGGRLLMVDPGADHLRELREIIYPSLKPTRDSERPIPPGFTQHDSQSVRYTITLTEAQQIADLLAMTPHLYRASAEGKAKAAALTALELTVDVRLLTYQRVAVLT